jgi:hypothetical protein
LFIFYIVAEIESDQGSKIGVEFKSKYLLSYRIPTEEHKKEVSDAIKEREARISDCKKLLDDLPKSLKRSISALDEVPEDADFNETGPLVVEQKRIKRDIEKQTALLPQLESSPVPKLDVDKFIPNVKQDKIVFHYGYNRLPDGTGYQLIAAHDVAITTQSYTGKTAKKMIDSNESK